MRKNAPRGMISMLSADGIFTPSASPTIERDVARVLDEAAREAAEQRIGLAALHRQRADHRGVGADDGAGGVRRHARAADERVEGRDVVAVARIVLGVDDLEVAALLERQAEALEALLDHRRAADQDDLADLLLDDHLRGAQHALLLAVGEGDALPLPARLVDDRLHHEAGAEDEAVELLAVGVEIGDRALGDAGVHRGPRHRRRDPEDQPLVERVGDQVVAPEGRPGARSPRPRARARGRALRWRSPPRASSPR